MRPVFFANILCSCRVGLRGGPTLWFLHHNTINLMKWVLHHNSHAPNTFLCIRLLHHTSLQQLVTALEQVVTASEQMVTAAEFSCDCISQNAFAYTLFSL